MSEQPPETADTPEQPNRQRLLARGRAHQRHGDDIFVPEREEAEQDDRDDRGFRHGEDDLKHRAPVAGAIHIGGLLEIMRQRGKVARQQIDRKGQRRGRIYHRQHHQIVE